MHRLSWEYPAAAPNQLFVPIAPLVADRLFMVPSGRMTLGARDPCCAGVGDSLIWSGPSGGPLASPETGDVRGTNHQWTCEDCHYPIRPHRLTLALLLSHWPHCSSSPWYCLSWEIGLEIHSRSPGATDYYYDHYTWDGRRCSVFLCLFSALHIGPC